jgi:hypothetical protein
MDNHVALLREMDSDALKSISMEDCHPDVVEKLFLYGAKMLAGTAKKKPRKAKVSLCSS